MTIASLVKGLAVLLALLIIVGWVGGIGSVELLIWLGLVAAWIGWWMASRRKGEAALQERGGQRSMSAADAASADMPMSGHSAAP